MKHYCRLWAGYWRLPSCVNYVSFDIGRNTEWSSVYLADLSSDPPPTQPAVCVGTECQARGLVYCRSRYVKWIHICKAAHTFRIARGGKKKQMMPLRPASTAWVWFSPSLKYNSTAGVYLQLCPWCNWGLWGYVCCFFFAAHCLRFNSQGHILWFPDSSHTLLLFFYGSIGVKQSISIYLMCSWEQTLLQRLIFFFLFL